MMKGDGCHVGQSDVDDLAIWLDFFVGRCCSVADHLVSAREVIFRL